jgi:HEAT repeat protein
MVRMESYASTSMRQGKSMIRVGIGVAAAVALAIVSGCAKEERGPLLLGGREVQSWLKDLNDPQPQVRRQAVLKLGNLGKEDNPTIAEGLAGALGDKDAIVRREAILSVVKLKHPAPAMIERLDAMGRNDRDLKVRDAAKQAASHLAALK